MTDYEVIVVMLMFGTLVSTMIFGILSLIVAIIALFKDNTKK